MRKQQQQGDHATEHHERDRRLPLQNQDEIGNATPALIEPSDT